MNRLNNTEFYGTPEGSVMICEDDKPLRKYEQSDRLFTESMIEHISTFYTKAFSALCSIYTPSKLNKTYFEYMIVHRFIRCNFWLYDGKKDIENGVFNFEQVCCPLRGECKFDGIICHAEFNTNLTERELEVMRCFFNDIAEDDIADKLFISIMTVRKHKQNSLQKLGIKTLRDFISYAHKNKMFER
jgi:DNA-binding CsgD family transcriptional regulator